MSLQLFGRIIVAKKSRVNPGGRQTLKPYFERQTLKHLARNSSRLKTATVQCAPLHGCNRVSASGKPKMPFWKCYYHIVWATKNRQPMITPSMEAILFSAIRSKSEELRCPVIAINAVADHIHVAVSIRPALALVDWIGQAKGASSHTMNRAFDKLEDNFRWQESYGVVTFGARNTPLVVDYIEKQKEHHQMGNLQPYLEQIDE